MPCAVVRGRLWTPLLENTQQTKPEQSKEVDGLEPVSYTHLDVYKRQLPIQSPGVSNERGVVVQPA